MFTAISGLSRGISSTVCNAHVDHSIMLFVYKCYFHPLQHDVLQYARQIRRTPLKMTLGTPVA